MKEIIKSDGCIDGRSLKRTGRTVQFSTKVHPEFKINLAKAAIETGQNYNQILEESLKQYLINLEARLPSSRPE